MAESKTSARKLTALERELRSLELRKTGATYREIGRVLGITEQGAYKAVVRALAKLREKVLEEAQDVRDIELLRLDRMFLSMYAKATAGGTGAVDRCLRIMERRAHLLGLDKPTKHGVRIANVDVGQMTDDELRAIING